MKGDQKNEETLYFFNGCNWLFDECSCIRGFHTSGTLPTADLETAGTAVAALIAVAVVIGVVFRLIKKA